MSTINATDRIQSDTRVHIFNGNWTRYFMRDAVTKTLLSITYPPNQTLVEEIDEHWTYQDLHQRDNISISKIKTIDRVTLLPNPDAQVITLSSNKLYTDGHRILTTHSATYAVAQADTFKQCPVMMTDDITQQLIEVKMSHLHSMDSEMMRKTLHNLVAYGTHQEKLYMRVSLRYNKAMRATYQRE